MKTKIIEVGNGGFNWGKFMLGRFDSEWSVRSSSPGNDLQTPLLRQRGWGNEHLLIVDLETGEGAIFRPGGYAKADLDKHKVWVCPMYEPFLEWLYKQDLSDLDALPAHVELDAPGEMYGYRRPGPATEHVALCRACGWNESWTTPEAAEAASVVHVHDEHPEIWREQMGDAPLPATPPSEYGRRFEDWERQG